MITEEERQSIIQEVFLKMPEVIGNLMSNHAVMMKLNKELYSKFPEFVNSKDVVSSVIEMIEGKNPGLAYEKVVEQAIPVIKDRIKTIKPLDVTSVNKPSRDLNGVL